MTNPCSVTGYANGSNEPQIAPSLEKPARVTRPWHASREKGGNSMANTETSVVDTSQYTHPEVLVGTGRVAQHLNDSNVRLIEADEEVLLYERGHSPNAVKLDWHSHVPGPTDGAHPERMWTLTAMGGLEL
jgi:hypothetical protein